MTLATAQLVTRSIVVGTPILVALAWGGWDLFVWLRFGDQATESHYIWMTSQKWPLPFLAIFLFAAFLCWHIFVGPEPAPGETP